MLFTLESFVAYRLDPKVPKLTSIIGSAPSIKNTKSDKTINYKIGVGDMPWRAKEFGPYDAWVTANGYYPLPQKRNHSREMRKLTKVTFISEACLQRERNPQAAMFKIVELAKKTDIVVYSTCHSYKDSCVNQSYCCTFTNYFKIEKTVQELFKNKFKLENITFPIPGTAAVWAFMISLILDSKKVLLSGIELPQTLENYKHYRNWKSKNWIDFIRREFLAWRKPHLANDIGETFFPTMECFRIIANAATKFDKTIYCTSKTSSLLNIPEIEYKK